MIAYGNSKRSQVLFVGDLGPEPSPVYIGLEVEMTDTLVCVIPDPISVTLCREV